MHGKRRVDEIRVGGTREVMEGACNAPGLRPREVGGIGEDLEQHVGRVEDLPPVSMGGHEAEKPIQLQHRPLRRSGEDAGKGTGSREDPTIHTPPIVEQIADGNLELLLLGGCGGWGRVGSGALGVRRAVVWGDVEGRRGCRRDAEGSEAEQHGVDVARVGQGQGAVGAVVIQGEGQGPVGCNRATLKLKFKVLANHMNNIIIINITYDL